MRTIVCLILISLLGLSSSFAASQKSTANLVIGEAEYQKKGKGKWRTLKVGAKIRDKDVVRTFAASKVDILFATGTVLRIEENSLVAMKELWEEGVQQKTNINIKQGKILFNIKKLSDARSSFQFETATATAAIRGTAGGIGKNGRKTFAYLDKGKVELKNKNGGKSFFIGPQDFAIESKNGFNIKKLPQGTDLDKILKKAIQSSEDLNLDSLSKALPDSLKLDSLDIPASLIAVDTLVPEAFFEWFLPADGATIPRSFELSGKAVPGTKISIFKNSVLSDAEGKWSMRLKAPKSGETVLTISYELNGNVESLQRQVIVERSPGEISGSIDTYPTTVSVPEVDIKGTCLGGNIIRIGEQEAAVKDGLWSHTLYWSGLEQGVKTFSVSCLLGAKTVDLGEITVLYEVPLIPLDLKTSAAASFTINNGQLQLQGSYTGNNAKLFLMLGDKEFNISTPSGDFAITKPITDASKSWQYTEASLILRDGEQEIRREFSIEVNQKSKAVNTISPDLQVSIDKQNGQAKLSISKMQQDKGVVTIYSSGDELETFEFEGDQRGRVFKLLPGVNDYRFVVTDQAGNHSEKSFSQVAIWKRVDLKIDVSSRGKLGSVRMPPLPPGSAAEIQEFFLIRLRNVPNDDHRFIKRILVENNIMNFRQDLRGRQIDDVEIEVEIPLTLKKRNTIKIRVEPQVGNPIHKEVFFEVLR